MTRVVLLAMVIGAALRAGTIDLNQTFDSNGCTFRFIDLDGNAQVAGPCFGVPVGTVVNGITVGFNPVLFEEPGPVMMLPPVPPLPPPLPPIEPPVVPLPVVSPPTGPPTTNTPEQPAVAMALAVMGLAWMGLRRIA